MAKQLISPTSCNLFLSIKKKKIGHQHKSQSILAVTIITVVHSPRNRQLEEEYEEVIEEYERVMKYLCLK